MKSHTLTVRVSTGNVRGSGRTLRGPADGVATTALAFSTFPPSFLLTIFKSPFHLLLPSPTTSEPLASPHVQQPPGYTCRRLTRPLQSTLSHQDTA
ncbi:unnamed protein product [Mesocestoides corti]|uniref:Uncharacterized protein n=1 Tax=Mesocestoides corti TaxID=53468 RepID=A0A0R3U341_MESCO|nr:unnamed protein product [Mesocestoides corti]